MSHMFHMFSARQNKTPGWESNPRPKGTRKAHLERFHEAMPFALNNGHLGALLVLEGPQREGHRLECPGIGEEGPTGLHLQRIRDRLVPLVHRCACVLLTALA